MKKSLFLLFSSVALFFLAVQVNAETHKQAEHTHHMPHGRHHLSLLTGATNLEGETAFTQGIDYEYRVNELLGLGGVAEFAAGDIDALTLLAVADIHFKGGLIMQLGPGFEFGEEKIFVGRIGALYEFEYHRYTLSPQLHYDFHEGSDDAVVFGLAVGFAF